MVADCNPFASRIGNRPEQIVLVGIFYRDFDDIARLQGFGNIAQEDIAVDFGRIGTAARSGADAAIVIGFANLVDNHRQRASDLGGLLGGADRGGLFHDTLIALFLDLFGHGIGQGIGGGAFDGFEPEGPTRSSCASSSQSSRYRKSASVSPGKPTTKLERMAISGAILRQLRMRSSTLASFAGRFIAFSTGGAACWNGMSR